MKRSFLLAFCLSKRLLLPSLLTCCCILLIESAQPSPSHAANRPNILFAIADDWGWPHAGAYGEPVIKTPTFDRIASKGILFTYGFVSSPTCTASRSSILTGQWPWRLGAAANLHSVFPNELETYPEILEKAGYFVGSQSKGWGPGRPETPGRELAGKNYKNFQEFLQSRPSEKPFCFWLGSTDPHRPYRIGAGKERGMDLEQIRLPSCFPDSTSIRSDVADYFWEVERFDRLVGNALKSLEQFSEVNNTVVVVCGDHGMPFPRCKSNLYDAGTRIPLVISFPDQFPAGRRVDDFVSLCDLAPTFLELAGLLPRESMTGRSLVDLLRKENTDLVDLERNCVLLGKERHVPSQEAPDMGGYPSRAIRTREFLYVYNFRSDRWPAGTPHFQRAAIPGAWYADCDNGPTKAYIVDNRDKDNNHRRLFQLAFGKRPAEELYDLRADPEQLSNLASKPEYRVKRDELADRLLSLLQISRDPRALGPDNCPLKSLQPATGNNDPFDRYPYRGGAPQHPDNDSP